MFPSRVPTWFLALVTAVYAGVIHALGWHELEAPGVQMAFWGFIIPIATWVWGALTTVSTVSVQWLQYAVTALWAFARSTYAGVLGLGKDVLRGFNKAWGFVKGLYTDLLRPAWLKFWKLVDWAKTSLERLFRPVINLLLAIRKHILDFYAHYVRPILDAIDSARRILRILGSLGLDWAKRLDAELGKIQDAIDRPFRILLREVNRIIGIIDSIVTANGLFQRLALIRSIERDMAYINRSMWRRSTRPLTPEEEAAGAAVPETKTPEEHAEELTRALETNDGRIAYRGDELVADLRLMLERGAGRRAA